jgi:hypothetical protein
MHELLESAIEAGDFVDWDIVHRFEGELVLDFGLDSCRRRHLVWCQSDWLVLGFQALRALVLYRHVARHLSGISWFQMIAWVLLST